MAEDITQWLEARGFGEYAQAFKENRIDLDVLSRLTEDDLKDLGLPIGDRRRLQGTIDAWFAKDPPTGAVAPPTQDHEYQPAEAERRQVTVMFSDLVGSTQLAGTLDPEDLRDLMAAYQDVCKAAIERYGGYVARYMGDGVLAYFGYPTAHEDDAERAVRAGLALAQGIKKLSASGRLPRDIQPAVRVGVATGPVVVGDLIGEGASQESTVVGETPNLAARLQTFAEPGTVVVAPSTQRLTAGLFEYRDHGEQAFKGIGAPTRVWAAVGESSSESRFEATHGRTLSPLVGREEELETLLRRWERAKDGEGQVVLISGEAGIGKSRLCRTFRERIAGDPHARLHYQCSPHHVNSALYPVVTQLARMAEIDANATPAEKLRRLETFLGQSSDNSDRAVPLFANLLSIPTSEDKQPLAVDAEQEKEKALSILLSHVESLAAHQPLLVLFEDLHWVDPSTQEFLDRLIERVEQLPALVLVTFRPEFNTPWIGLSHVSFMILKRLSRRQSEAMVADQIRIRSLSLKQREEIIAKTDGVPLFIEEFTRAVLDVEAHGSGDGGGRATEPSIPTTLQNSLMARLDRLTIGKRVAQTGAAIAREFTQDLLGSIMGLEPGDMARGLDELVNSGLIYRRGVGTTATYTFKHALLQDAAYQSLLHSSRRPLHRRIAEELTIRAPEQVSLLAYHWERAESLENALPCRLDALHRSLRLFALREGIAHYWSVMGLLERLPDTEKTRRRYVDILMAMVSLGNITLWRDERERAQALQQTDRAISAAAEIGNSAATTRLRAYKGRYWHDEPLLVKAMKDADALGDLAVQAEVAQRYAGYLGERGRFDESCALMDQAINILGELGATVRQGIAMAQGGRCYAARSGRLDDALRYASQARELAAATDDLRLKRWIAMEAEPCFYKGAWEKTVQVVEEGLPYAWETGTWMNVLWSSAWAAIACVKLGRLEDARGFLERALSGADQEAGLVWPRVYPRIALSQLLLASGDAEDADASAQMALELAESSESLLEVGAALRALGQASAAANDAANADKHFRRSLEVLGEIQSRPELAQSLLAYGQFKLKVGDGEAKQLLQRALRIFEEIDAPGWIDETQAALSQLDQSAIVQNGQFGSSRSCLHNKSTSGFG